MTGPFLIDALVAARVVAVEGATVGSRKVRIRTDRGTLTVRGEGILAVEAIEGSPDRIVGGVISFGFEGEEPHTGGLPSQESYRVRTVYTIHTSRGNLTVRWLGGFPQSVTSPDVSWRAETCASCGGAR